MTPSTRRFETPTGAPPDRSPPMFNVPPVTLAFLGLLLAAFAGLQLAGPIFRQEAVFWLSLVPLRVAVAVEGPFGAETLFAAATLITHAFIHLELLHFIANAGFLLAFGSQAERSMGPVLYLRLLMASAAGGGLAQLLVDWGEQVVMFGASGVVSGCMGGVVRLMIARDAAPRSRRAARNLTLAFLVINVLFALLGGRLLGIDADVAWEAHLGGFAAGFLTARRRRIDPAA